MSYTVCTHSPDNGITVLAEIGKRLLTPNERTLLIEVFDDINSVAQNQEGATRIFLFDKSLDELKNEPELWDLTPLNTEHW